MSINLIGDFIRAKGYSRHLLKPFDELKIIYFVVCVSN